MRPSPSPIPLGNKWEQAEFVASVQRQTQENSSPEAFKEADEARKAKLEYEGFEGAVNPETGEVN